MQVEKQISSINKDQKIYTRQNDKTYEQIMNYELLYDV